MHGLAVTAVRAAAASSVRGSASAWILSPLETKAIHLAPWAPLTVCARWLGEWLVRQLLAGGGAAGEGQAHGSGSRSNRALARSPLRGAASGPRLPHRRLLGLLSRAGAAPRRPRAAVAATVASAAAALSPHNSLSLGLSVAAAATAAGAASFSSLGAAGAAAAGGLVIRGAGHLLRRWQAGRRGGAGRRGAPLLGGVGADAAREVSVLTFNIRGIMDRWPERRPLLAETLRRLDADVVCFQEVLTGEKGWAAGLVWVVGCRLGQRSQVGYV
jgi:hypothetical protein